MPPSFVPIALLLLIALVNARPEFRAELPNALATEKDGLKCAQLGHTMCVPGKLTVNKFGADFKAAGYKWTKEFCEMDSDGDGVSNGAELGDPCCIFAPGDGVLPTRTTDLSDPNDPEATPTSEDSKVCSEGEVESAGSATTSDKSGTAGGTASAGESGAEELETASSAPESSVEPSGEPVDCFAGDAEVLLRSGAVKKMEDLAVGDHVQVGPNQFSQVFMFTHKIRNTVFPHEFVHITTESSHSIELTPGHYIQIQGSNGNNGNNGLVRAGDVRIGDLLTTGAGNLSPVVRIRSNILKNRGLYNPQTKHGDIVVNGITASTYTDGCEAAIAHALLAPFRALHPLFEQYFQLNPTRSVGS